MKEQQSDLIDFSALIHQYTAKWYWFAISVTVCMILGFFYSRTVRPEYEVKANVRLTENSSAGNLMSNMKDMSSLFGGNANAEDEVEVVTSHTVLRDVAVDLGLNRTHFIMPMPMSSVFMYEAFPVDVVPSPAIDLDTLRTNINFKVKVNDRGIAKIEVRARGKKIFTQKNVELPAVVALPYGDFTVSLTPDYKPGKAVKTAVNICGNDDAAETLRKQVNVGLASKHSQIINMQMITDNVDYAEDVLNALIARYNAIGLEQNIDQMSATARFIDGRLQSMRTELDSTEHVFARYKADNSMVEYAGNTKLLFEKIGATEKQLNDVEVNVEMGRLRLQMVKESAKDNSLLPSIEEAKAPIDAYNALVTQRLQLERSAKPGNQQLQQIDEQIGRLRQNIITTLQQNQAVLEKSLAEYRSIYDGLMAQTNSTPGQELSYHDIERERLVQEQLYIYLLQKKEETAIMISNASPKGAIVDAAYSLNEDNAISRKMILAICFILGLMIPPLALYFKKLLRTKFQTREEVEDIVTSPVLGEVCQDHTGDVLVVRPNGSSSTAELFRLIRANLQFVMRDPNDKVVLMTSTSSGEGKSFVSINMAASFALLNKRVLLIGADIRKPRLEQYLGLPAGHKGLTQYLASPSMPIDDIIQHYTALPGLDIIVAGPIPPNPSEMLASEKVDRLFNELRKMYDIIIVDSAPVGMVSDSFLLARISDATIYVTRANVTKVSDLKFANELYASNKLNRMGIVVNGTASRRGYGYGYGEKQ